MTRGPNQLARGTWRGKVACRQENVEVVIGPHRADIVGKASRVIELQHSSVSGESIAAREEFYGDMLWLFDATERFEFVTVGKRAFFALRRVKHLNACTKPVYLDFGNCIIEVETFSTAVAKMSGFGKVRSRQWFAEQHLDLCNDPPPTLESRPIRWLKDKRYESTQHASNWVGLQGTYTIPKGAAHLPMNWYEVGTPRVYEWERVINQHGELANGWTKESLESMQRFLQGKIVILDGLLRLMPAAAATIQVSSTVVATKMLLDQVNDHIAAGRIPILKDTTKDQLLRSAAEYERRHGGLRREQQPPLFE